MEEHPQSETILSKNYSIPKPTIQDCIALYELLSINNIDKNIDGISSIIYEQDDLLNEFLQKIDDRLTISNQDPKGAFIKCEYNRDKDSYRSPFSNTYYPSLSDCQYPSEDLRILEKYLNSSFKIYTSFYYSSTACSSVYCWNSGNSIKDGFCCAILIKNSVETSESKGVWNSHNILTATFNEKNKQIYGDYKLISTVMLQMGFGNKYNGKADLSGSLSRKVIDFNIKI